jgi:nucleoid-associated protein YgaU
VSTTDARSTTGEADEPLAPIGGQVYTVQKGDTLYKLARRFYNDQSRWRDIWEANRNRIPDPDKIAVGMKLIIP